MSYINISNILRCCDGTEVQILTGYQTAQDRASRKSDVRSSNGCWRIRGAEIKEVRHLKAVPNIACKICLCHSV